ncbi:LysR family transcriptional regulator [Clostridium sp. 'deep sea']|uniref:LysR family transcriptional regulator n=1 Tax=Clostridium sp. 'deep sea' TaxID=2779445 RepID=UPI001896534B|nr:LysR family transcriptional regulator [Clostridium sp. 'deep sea']QOR35125.1 LysR family transcriptional regulator [Clostridium sp. 'deep sea']
MNIQQIKQVLTIAALGSINKAAKELFLSQPNLSLSIKNLEDELQNFIFTRTSKGVELTEFGREFIAIAQPAYQQFNYLEEFCSSITYDAPLSFSVSSQYFKFASSVFIDVYNKYKNKNTNFSFKEEPILQVISSVHNQQSEIGILLLSSMQKKVLLRLLKSRGINYYKFTTEKASIIIGPNNPYFSKNIKGVTRNMISNFPFVTYNDDQYNFSVEWAEVGIFNPNNRIYVSDRASMNDFLTNTNAFTVGVHNINAYNNTEYYKNLRALPFLDVDLTFELGWIANKSRPLSAIAQEYIDLVNDVLKL